MQSKAKYLGKSTLCVLIALVIAFAPFNVNLIKGVHIEKNEAHAVSAFGGAYDFLNEMSEEAGFESAGDFIASVAGITAVTTGKVIGGTSRIAFGFDVTRNLQALIDAADYPAWSTLSSSEQSNWGSESNYDSAKFDSLMAAFGMGDAYERYQNAWGNAGATGFSFSSNEVSVLDQIGSIGMNWANGVGNSIQDIIDDINFNHANFNRWVPANNYSYTKQASDTLWPSGLPETLNFQLTQRYTFTYTQSSRVYNYIALYSQPVYVLSGSYSTTNNTGTVWYTFSSTSASYGYSTNGDDPTPNSNMTHATSTGDSLYFNSDSRYRITNNSVTESGSLQALVTAESNERDYVLRRLLYGANQTSGVSEMQDYPASEIENETYDPDTVIYFPNSGIDSETQWDDMLAYQEEVTEDLSGIIQLLQRIDSDINSGFGKFLYDNNDYLLVKDPAIYSLLNTQLSKFHFNADGDLIVNDPKLKTAFDSFVTAFNTWKSLFTFYNTGELKVHDLEVYTELSDIYSLLLEISGKLNNYGDISDAPEIIGDFDFDDIADRVPNLLEVIENVAPFGAMLILAELYTVLSSVNPIDEPEFVVPFQFGGLDNNQEVTIDLSWMDDIKPVINFFCILMLLLAMTRVTMRIVELEAAS